MISWMVLKFSESIVWDNVTEGSSNTLIFGVTRISLQHSIGMVEDAPMLKAS